MGVRGRAAKKGEMCVGDRWVEGAEVERSAAGQEKCEVFA